MGPLVSKIWVSRLASTGGSSVLKVFISWSGLRSKNVASHVKAWVSQVFQGTEVFMSDQDIKAGTNWSERIKKELANTTVGIVCMTPENQDAKWINYEMGALSKEVHDGESRVIPLLIGFGSTSDVGQPAASLNMVMLNEQGFKKIAVSLNDVSEIKREKTQLDEVSDVWWGILGSKMMDAASETPEVKTSPPTDRELAEEILAEVRSLKRAETASKDANNSYIWAAHKLLGEQMASSREPNFFAGQLRRVEGRAHALAGLRAVGLSDAQVSSQGTHITVRTQSSVPDVIKEQFKNVLEAAYEEPVDVAFEVIESERDVPLTEGS